MFNVNPLWLAVLRVTGGPVPGFSAAFLESVPSDFQFTRATNATYFNSAGVLDWAPSQMVLNSTAVAGGGPSVVPSYWGASNISGGSTTVVGYGDSPITGTKYVDFRIQGTASGASNFPAVNFSSVPADSPVASLNQTWSGQCSVQRLNDANGNIMSLIPRMEIQESTTAGGYVDRTAANFTLGELQAGTRKFLTRPFTGATTGRARLLFVLTAAPGVPVDVTVRVWAPHLYLGISQLSYIPTTGNQVYYGPRIEYNPVTLGAQGLLMEGQGTNQVPNSEKVMEAFSTTITNANYFGAFRMTRVTGDGVATTHGTLQGTITPTGSSVYTLSCVVKYVSGSQFVQLTGSANYLADIANSYANFNIVTGVMTFKGSGCSTATIQPLGNGYFRISITAATIASPGGGTTILLCLVNSGTSIRAESNTTTSVIDAGMVQFEYSPGPTSYIPTTGSAATRGADSLVDTTIPWYNSSEGTVVVEWDRGVIPVAALAYNPIVAILRNSSTVRMAVMAGSGTPAQQRWDVADTTNQAAVLFGNGVYGQVYKAACTYKVNDFRAYQNGVAATADTSGTVPQGITGVELGNYGTTSPLGGHIRRFEYYPTALTNTKLQALST